MTTLVHSNLYIWNRRLIKLLMLKLPSLATIDLIHAEHLEQK